MPQNFQTIENVYQGQRGFTVEFDTDFDFTGIDKVILILEKPSGNKVLREVSVSDYAQGPNSDLVYGRIIDGDIDEVGDIYAQIAAHSTDETIVLFSYQVKIEVWPPSATVAEVLAVP